MLNKTNMKDLLVPIGVLAFLLLSLTAHAVIDTSNWKELKTNPITVVHNPKPYHKIPINIDGNEYQMKMDLARGTFLDSMKTCREYGKIGVKNLCQIVEKKNKKGWIYFKPVIR